MTRTVSPSPEQLSERARESLAAAHEGVNKRLIALDIRTGNIGRQGVMWVETTTALVALESTQAEIADLKHDLERQMTIANTECNNAVTAQAEIARLTTVSGDMVEEMARAICAIKGIEADRMEGPLRRPLWERQASIARVCASIAKGRIERLEAALRDMIRLADMGLEESLHEPEENGNFAAYNRARAALKDSPNVG
jgi:cell division protein ZapA (FtsZ GTPase activity inhibitor)